MHSLCHQSSDTGNRQNCIKQSCRVVSVFIRNPSQVFICWFDVTHRSAGELNFRFVGKVASTSYLGAPNESKTQVQGMRFRCCAYPLVQERENASLLCSVGIYLNVNVSSHICLLTEQDNSSCLTIFLGADVFSCGMSPGTALWL